MEALGRSSPRTVRPALIGRDLHAELDGIGARAACYCADLARGRWALPTDSYLTTTSNPREKNPS
jgi:hypothetical protein